METGYFAQIPIEILFSDNLSEFQKVLFAAIHGLSNQKGYCYASNKYIAEKFDKDILTISRNISILQDEKLIFISDNQGGRGSKRRIYTISTFTEYLKHISNIDKNINVNIDKNINVYSNKISSNKISKNKSSKEDSSSAKNSTKLPKIIKNVAPKDSDTFGREKPKPKAKYEYSIIDEQLYNELVELGATKHNEEKQAYFTTMNLIHEILSPDFRNPYCASKNIPDDYKTKEWDFDEILDTFKYYLSIADQTFYKSTSAFLYSNGYGTKTWSPLVKFHIDMHQDNGNTLEGDEKKLMKSLRNINVTELDAPAVKRTLKLLDLYTAGYRVNQQLNHLYYGNVIPLFVSHVKNHLRRSEFKPVYIQGEKFMKQFINDTTKDRSLVKGNYGYASSI